MLGLRPLRVLRACAPSPESDALHPLMLKNDASCSTTPVHALERRSVRIARSLVDRGAVISLASGLPYDGYAVLGPAGLLRGDGELLEAVLHDEAVEHRLDCGFVLQWQLVYQLHLAHEIAVGYLGPLGGGHCAGE